MKKVLLRLIFATLLCSLTLTFAFAQGAQESQTGYSGLYQALSAQTASIVDVKAPSTYLYTNKLAYMAGETMTVSFAMNPNDNPYPFDSPYCSMFLYMEDLQTGVKTYMPAGKTSPVSNILNMGADGYSGQYMISRVINTKAEYGGDIQWYGPSGYFGSARQVPSTAGSYRWVMELRDATGTIIQSIAYAPFNVVESIETLPNEINADLTLTNNKAYILSGMVFVNAPATLTIEPGTIIFGDQATEGGLCITQGAKINAVGTAVRPIVFTSIKDVGNRSPGDWFGVAIAGYSPINVTGGIGYVEGISTNIPYGGDDPEDNSGIMRYVRIEYAGLKYDPEHEANGLYLNGVGSETVLEYLHFNQNSDDNIEFFGGTAQVKYVFCSGGQDDQLDWTEGWQGKAQFVITQVYPDSGGNRGIEADNWQNDNDAVPRSSPMIYNMTIVGPQQNYAEGEGKADHGLMLRRGTAGKLFNFIVIGYGRDAIKIDGDPTKAQASAGNLKFDNAILYNNGVFGADGVGPFADTDTQNLIQTYSTKVLTDVDPKLIDPYNTLTPDYRPGYLSPAMRIDVVKHPPDDGFFSPVEFIGGMGPDNNWLAGGWVYVTPK